MSGEVKIGDRVRILRGAWRDHTAHAVAVTEASVKADFTDFARWYARSEVKRMTHPAHERARADQEED